MGKLLLSGTLVLFVLSFVFAQGADCTDANRGQQICVSEGQSASFFECGQNGWISSSCISPKVCTQVNSNLIFCKDPSACANPDGQMGDKYCVSPGTSPSFFECGQNGWISSSCVGGQVCQKLSDTQTFCQAPLGCVNPIGNEGDKYCSTTPGHPQGEYFECSNGQWFGSLCSGSCVQSTSTTISCQSTGGSTCTNPSGVNSDETCISNKVHICSNGNWLSSTDCASIDADCVVAGVDAYCQSRGGSSTGSSGGSGGSGGTGSGGGSVQSCNKWSDWFVDSSTQYNENSVDGISQTCIKSVLKRWCVNPSGTYNYSKYESKEQVDCSIADEGCEFVYDRSQSYEDKSSTQCRQCTKEIYVEQCQPSGKINYEKTKEQISCTSWGSCTQTAEQDSTEDSGAVVSNPIDVLLKEYWSVLAILMAILFLVVAYTGWKMFSAKPDE